MQVRAAMTLPLIFAWRKVLTADYILSINGQGFLATKVDETCLLALTIFPTGTIPKIKSVGIPIG